LPSTARGRRCAASAHIVNRTGEVLRRNFTEYERAVDPRGGHLLRYALREVVREGTGRGVYRYLDDVIFTSPARPEPRTTGAIPGLRASPATCSP
jgi:hypothetical protein